MAMQAAVNAIGTNAVAGYTTATKVDQMSVLVNNAFGVTLSTYVAQNYGAGKIDRIKRGFNACFLMTECANLL
ncbi:MATE family efflux transporter, partial [Akkermansia sp. GGCC_0220]|nr:MATE family efflux transporter [Akkermansia sp. GGCC_0220]